MIRPRFPRSGRKGDGGFSAVELLIATAITLIVLAGAMASFDDVLGLNEQSTQIADLEQNLRAGINLLVRDFVTAGWGIPIGGISIPSGAGSVAVHRPGPPGSSYTFNAQTISAVNPGSNLGPFGNDQFTDMVNILYADSQFQSLVLTSIGTDGISAEVAAATPIAGVPNPIQSGDLIYFSNGLGNTLQFVTKTAGQTLHFELGATMDAMGLNQPAAAAGSIKQLQNGTTFPPTAATRVWLVSYYLDYTTDPQTPRLMRRINARPAEPVALVLEDLQLTYDLVDGGTNPKDVASIVAPNSPNQIRKVNILLSGRSNYPIRNTGEFLRSSLRTQVSLRCLSFRDRYAQSSP